MKIKVIAVGKIKEKFFKDAIDEYLKRLSSYCDIEIIEVNDEAIPDNASIKVANEIKEKEGNKIISKIKEKDYVISLNLHKKQYDSVEFSKKISNIALKGYGTIDFIIGGSLGLGENVISHSNEEITLSEMTFTHQMTRIIILEQIYRAYKIINNETYHKW